MYQVVDNATASATQTNTFPPKIFEKKKKVGGNLFVIIFQTKNFLILA